MFAVQYYPAEVKTVRIRNPLQCVQGASVCYHKLCQDY